MPLVNMKKILVPAHKNHYAVGAFNLINMEFLRGILGAAENRRAPLIVNIAEVHLPYMDVELMIAALRAAAGKSSLTVALNLDHGLSFESAELAVKQGFTSVMFDGSSLPLEENIRMTREIVKMCHSEGVSVEAELGAVGGSENGDIESQANPALYTDVNQVRDFIRRTQVDALAVAIGNSHGKYKGRPKLDLGRLKEINSAAALPLVLHGGSGISAEMFREAINRGISKINFYTGMSESALSSLKISLKASEGRYNNYPELMDKMRLAVQDTVEKQIDIFMNGKTV